MRTELIVILGKKKGRSALIIPTVAGERLQQLAYSLQSHLPRRGNQDERGVLSSGASDF